MDLTVLVRDPLTFFQTLAMILGILLTFITCLCHFVTMGMWMRDWIVTIALTILSLISAFPLPGLEMPSFFRVLFPSIFFVLGLVATFALSKRVGWMLLCLHLINFSLIYWLYNSLIAGGYPLWYIS